MRRLDSLLISLLLTSCDGEDTTTKTDSDPTESDTDTDTDADSDTDTDTPIIPCADVIAAGTVPETLTGTTIGAGDDSQGSCVDNQAPDVAIAYIAPQTAEYVFDLVGSDYDTLLYAFDGCSPPEIACNDDWNSAQSQIVLDLVAGQTAILVVDGYLASEGNYVLHANLLESRETDCGDGLDLDHDNAIDCADEDCVGSPLCVEICGDGLDNDYDYDYDCFDADCADDPTCGPEVCDDGIDNDADFTTDCFDDDCDGSPLCVEICGDGIDNDGDYASDCFDADCEGDPTCGIEICGDGIDNDADFTTDCFDRDCNLDPACTEDCTNGVDDDGDYYIDCFDAYCGLDPACVEICDDGIDNDIDGYLDCTDVYCAGDPACVEICDDGIDNDGDLYRDCFDDDCADDPICGPEICDDGVDNDTDATTDCLDRDCDLDPACAEVCDDGIDNDGDFDIDCLDAFCADDPRCALICPHDTLGAPPATAYASTLGLPDTHTPSCSNSSSPDYTWEFTAPAAGTYTFDTDGSSFDTILYALDGDCDGVELDCNDDIGGGNTRSRITLSLAAGQTVILVVDGYSVSSGDAVLNVQ